MTAIAPLREESDTPGILETSGFSRDRVSMRLIRLSSITGNALDRELFDVEREPYLSARIANSGTRGFGVVREAKAARSERAIRQLC